MAVLQVLKAEHPVLRQKAKRIGRIDASTQKIIDDMVETMYAVNGLGLAAPQVGVPLRLAVIQVPAEYEEPHAGELLVLINPEIVKAEDAQETDEACLSLPGYSGNIVRSQRVTFKALDRHGKSYKIKAEGMLAQAVQHELDHLNGVLYYDHLESPALLRKVTPPRASESDSTPVEPD
ncbi:MAG: peptide deformylase [Dehalococcoidales bacterium]|nr:peptide deformylase [Dehalococcoidales bacterium]